MNIDEKIPVSTKIVFKPKNKSKPARQPICIASDSVDEEDENEEDEGTKILPMLVELQKLKKPSSGGRNINELNASPLDSKLQAPSNKNMTAAEKQGLKDVEQLEKELALNNTFSAETNRRYEDAEMLKFIEDELQKERLESLKEKEKLNQSIDSYEEPTKSTTTLPSDTKISALTDDLLLNSLPKHLLTSVSDEKSEEMLSSQMLTGIPEVDLGLEEKIRTIEATEEAKQNLSKKDHKRQTGRSTVPVNIASNFSQHNRYRINDPAQQNKRPRIDPHNPPCKIVEEPIVVVGEEPQAIQFRQPIPYEKGPSKGRASDDYYLGKFKKNMQHRH